MFDCQMLVLHVKHTCMCTVTPCIQCLGQAIMLDIVYIDTPLPVKCVLHLANLLILLLSNKAFSANAPLKCFDANV